MEGFDLNKLVSDVKQVETIVAEKSNRPYTKVAATDKGKLFANFSLELVPIEYKKNKIPAVALVVRFASDGGSWGMELRQEGSALPGMTNLEKIAVPLALPGPGFYVKQVVTDASVVTRCFSWLQLIAAKNKAEVSVGLDWLEEMVAGLFANMIESEPVVIRFPGEVQKSASAPIKGIVKAPITKPAPKDDGEANAEG